jgi:hypothetical protein
MTTYLIAVGLFGLAVFVVALFLPPDKPRNRKHDKQCNAH